MFQLLLGSRSWRQSLFFLRPPCFLSYGLPQISHPQAYSLSTRGLISRQRNRRKSSSSSSRPMEVRHPFLCWFKWPVVSVMADAEDNVTCVCMLLKPHAKPTVTWEDQQNINKFSNAFQRQGELQALLQNQKVLASACHSLGSCVIHTTCAVDRCRAAASPLEEHTGRHMPTADSPHHAPVCVRCSSFHPAEACG